MARQNVIKKLKLYTIVICVITLVFVVGKIGYGLMSNSIVDGIRINKTTSSYLSFNYASNKNNILELTKVKAVSDFYGKYLLNNYFDFEVELPEDGNTNIQYDIIVKDIGNKIDGKYVKVYLTDQKNKPLKGFESSVPVYSALTDNLEGRIIYTSNLDGKENGKFRLRIWISDKYNKEINEGLAYQVIVKMK